MLGKGKTTLSCYDNVILSSIHAPGLSINFFSLYFFCVLVKTFTQKFYEVLITIFSAMFNFNASNIVAYSEVLSAAPVAIKLFYHKRFATTKL